MSEQDNLQLQIERQKIILKSIEEEERLLKDFHQEHLRLGMENIRQKRELIHLFILVSSGIIGALLVFENSNLIKNTNCTFVGSIFFLLVILYSFYYLTRILTKEGQSIDEFAKVFFKNLKLVKENSKKYIENPTTENWNNIKNSQEGASKQMNSQDDSIEKDEKKFAPGLHIIFWLFFIGLIFLIISIIDIQKIVIKFSEIIKCLTP